jgi:hypothetical protein
MTDPTTVTVLRTQLRALLDLAVGSLNFGSGFWDQEDVDVARAIAAGLGDVCPNACTPDDMISKYPPCVGTETAAAKWREAGYDEAFIHRNAGHDAHPVDRP